LSSLNPRKLKESLAGCSFSLGHPKYKYILPKVNIN